LEIKVLNIIVARCNHEVYQSLFAILRTHLKTNRLKLFREIVAVYSAIPTRNRSEHCGHIVQFFSSDPAGT